VHGRTRAALCAVVEKCNIYYLRSRVLTIVTTLQYGARYARRDSANKAELELITPGKLRMASSYRLSFKINVGSCHRSLRNYMVTSLIHVNSNVETL
jgi:hypothetical protein